MTPLTIPTCNECAGQGSFVTSDCTEVRCSECTGTGEGIPMCSACQTVPELVDGCETCACTVCEICERTVSVAELDNANVCIKHPEVVFGESIGWL